MAVTGTAKPFAFPKGESLTDRWQVFHGNLALTGSGNYAATGIPITWNPMVGLSTGNNVFPLGGASSPDLCWAQSQTGVPYNYAINSSGNLIVSPGQGVTNTAATASAVAITSNVLTVTATNTFAAGDVVYLQGFTTATYLNGAVGTVLASGLSGSAFKINFTHANDSQSDTGTATRTTIAVGVAIPAAVIADTIIFEAWFAKGSE